jgi:hypothetical protein
MYRLSRLVGLSLAMIALALLVPGRAQDQKGQSTAKDEKEAKAKSPDSKDTGDKKVDDKKADKSKKRKGKGKAKEENPEDKVSYGQILFGKMKQMDQKNEREFTLEIMVPDPEKIQGLANWMAQQQLSIAQQTNPINYRNAVAQYQLQLAQRQTQIYSPKDFEFRAADKIKVRTGYPPTEYDNRGKMKRWTAKELKSLKGSSKLPGYPAEYDLLRPGQYVAAYLAKQAPAGKSKIKGIKGLKIDLVEVPVNKPEVVMMVVIQEAIPGQR